MRVLILDSDQGLLGPVIQSLQGVPDLSLHVLTRDEVRCIRRSRFVCSASFCPAPEGGAGDLERVAVEIGKTGAEVLLPIDEPALELVSGNAASLAGLGRLPPLPSPEILEIASDKGLLSRFMEAKGIPQPRTVLLSGHKGDWDGFPFPALIKKRRGSGGVGIVVCPTCQEFEDSLTALGTEDGSYILQEFLSGEEIDCSLLAREGEILAYTIQRPLAPKNGFDFARAIEFVHDEEALSLTQRLITDLGYSGIAHVDMIRDHRTDELKVLEINPRFWGSLLGSNLAGVNFTDLAIRAACGLPLPPPGFREVKYATAKAAAKLLLRSLLPGPGPRVPFSQTNLTRYLADPALLAANSLQKISGRIRPR